jgi:methyltransferase-like protein
MRKCDECEQILFQYRKANAKLVAVVNRLSQLVMCEDSDAFRRTLDQSNYAHTEHNRVHQEFLLHFTTHDNKQPTTLRQP